MSESKLDIAAMGSLKDLEVGIPIKESFRAALKNPIAERFALG